MTIDGGFANPITAGGVLVQPAIRSPNFSQAGQTGWAVNADGSAFFFNIVATGTVNASGGITVGQPGGSEIVLNPNANQAFDVTTAIAGFLQAVGQFITTDGSEAVAGALGALLLGTGSATKMSTALTSAFGSSGAAILLESQNDGGTDTPVITFGTVTTPDGGTTLVYSPIATLTPFAFLLYGGISGQTVVTKTAGSGTIPIPAGVTTAKAEAWGAGSGGFTQFANALSDGGSSGEYACEPSLAVTGGGTVAYAVGAAGAAITQSGGSGSNASSTGGNSTLTGSAVTVTGHGASTVVTGGGTIVARNKGTGSANTVHFDGAAGGVGGQANGANGGGGGAGSAGTAAAGTAGGSVSSGFSGGAGGIAPTGGGNGGAGGAGVGSGSPHPGVAGSVPGGGGGGGGMRSTDGTIAAAAAGANGQVRLTYSSGAPAILFSVASASGTDQFGTGYPAGLAIQTNIIGNGILANTLSMFNEAAPGPVAGASAVFASGGQLQTVNPQGFNMQVVGSGLPSAFTYLTAGNTASGVLIAAISIPANDMIAGAVYELTADGWFLGGQTTSETMNLVMQIGGVNTGSTTTAALGISATGRWTLTARLYVKTTGSGGTCLAGGSFMMANTYYSLGNANGTAFALNTTIANVLAIQATWGGAGGSNQLLTCGFASLRRVA